MLLAIEISIEIGSRWPYAAIVPRQNTYKRSSYGISLSPKWILQACLLALALHIGLFLLFRETELKRYGEAYYDRIVPRSFKLERVEIDPALLDQPEKEPAAEPPKEIEQIAIPQEIPVAKSPPKEVRVAPSPDSATRDLLDDQPEVATQINQALDLAKSQLPNQDDPRIEQVDPSLLDPEPAVPGRPLLQIPTENLGEQSAPSAPAGFSDLDQLVADTGPVADNKPILMDAGLLFDYDSAELKPSAKADLEKLATLILRTPGARIRIEGHTDSFGPEPYNLALSQRRAMAVKQWLVQNASIPGEHIATTGFGKSQLIAPASGSIEEQQINRRVEIVINSSN